MPIYDKPKGSTNKTIKNNCVNFNILGDFLTTTSFKQGSNIDDCYFSDSNNGSNQNSTKNGILIQEPYQSFLTAELDAFDATQSYKLYRGECNVSH